MGSIDQSGKERQSIDVGLRVGMRDDVEKLKMKMKVLRRCLRCCSLMQVNSDKAREAGLSARS
jgi:hypothetical protein